MTAMNSESVWTLTRTALRNSADRFVRLATEADPTAAATADWSVADTVAHVHMVAWMDVRTFVPGTPELPVPEFDAFVARTTVETLDRLNSAFLTGMRERSMVDLTEAFTRDVGLLLERTEQTDPDHPIPWLGGSRLPTSGLLAHLVNEILVHGWDIAQACDLDWSLPPEEAARFFDAFLAGVTRLGVGRLQERDDPPPRRPITLELTSPDVLSVVMTVDGRDIFLGTGGRPIDVRVRYEPGPMALMLFGRTGRIAPVVRRQVQIAGPRPWLVFPFLRAVRFPS
jgi:uncharacterized protein (TIGR03083 family)